MGARMQFKLCTLMHAIHNKRCPAYLADVVQLVGMSSMQTGLHSENSSNYSLPLRNTRLGERAFAYAGLAALEPTTRKHLPAANYIFQTETQDISFRIVL